MGNMKQINLTKALTKACLELASRGEWNGLSVMYVSVEGEDEKRRDAQNDGLSAAATEAYITDYCCVSIHLEFDDMFDSDCPYVSTVIDCQKIDRDFKDWILPYIGNDESLLPSEIDLQGGDMEFMKPGYTTML